MTVEVKTTINPTENLPWSDTLYAGLVDVKRVNEIVTRHFDAADRTRGLEVIGAHLHVAFLDFMLQQPPDQLASLYKDEKTFPNMHDAMIHVPEVRDKLKPVLSEMLTKIEGMLSEDQTATPTVQRDQEAVPLISHPTEEPVLV